MARKPKIVQGSRAAASASTAPAAISGDVSVVHPDLAAILDDYQDMRDCAAGFSAVKRAGERYLPKPDGFRAQADDGRVMYDAYLKRAQYPEIFAPTISGMVGVIHRNEAMFEGLEEGSQLAYLWESATPDGLPLETLHRRLTQSILTYGRAILYVDVPREGGDPYIAMYAPDALVNWSEARDFFVLKEQYRVRTGYAWTTKDRYRVLELVSGEYTVKVVDESGRATEGTDAGRTDVRSDEVQPAADVVVPNASGGKTLDRIPLVVAGSRDLGLAPDEIPLAGVARASLALYRLDADYRHQLFMSGQETLTFSGLDKEDIPQYVGAGVAVALPKDATASYVGPRGVGIQAHREAMKDERDVASAAGARIFDISQRGAESGDALRTRSRAASATLVTVALTSAAALERVLRHVSVFVGGDPESVVVRPNLDFVDAKLTPTEAKDLMELWLSGAISYQTFYDNLQSGEIASQERTAAEEQELAAQEQTATLDEDAAALGEETDPEAEATEDELDARISDEELAEMFDPALLRQAGIGG